MAGTPPECRWKGGNGGKGGCMPPDTTSPTFAGSQVRRAAGRKPLDHASFRPWFR